MRPMEFDEYQYVVDYFHDSPDDLLRRMGVDRALLPEQQSWLAHLRSEHSKAPGQAERLWLCWLLDSQPVGHSSLSDIELGKRANIHLHIWRPLERGQGFGTRLFELSVDYAFEHLDLARLYCEPKADNPVPNRVAKKLGFQLVETRWTTPGAITFEQQTNVYMLERRPAR